MPPEYLVGVCHGPKGCRYKTCRQSSRCRMCKWRQDRRCSSVISPVQQEKIMLRSVCGLPGQVRIVQTKSGMLPDTSEVGTSPVKFTAETTTCVRVELAIIHHLAYEDRCINGSADVNTILSCEIRPSDAGQALLTACTEAGCDVATDCVYSMPLPAAGCAQELDLNCCVTFNSTRLGQLCGLKLGSHGKLRLAVKVVDPATGEILACLVGEPFHVLTGRSLYKGSVNVPDGGPFASDNPVTVLSDVGVKVAAKLLRIPAYCADFMKDRSDTIPEGIGLPVAVRTVGEAKDLHDLIEERWPGCPLQLKHALLPRKAIQQLKHNVLMRDTCLRRWKAPGGQWELLFKADQGCVTDLEVVLEHVPAANGAVIVITMNARLGSDLCGVVDACCKLALEQLQEDGHPGWSVLEWEVDSLYTYLLAQQPYTQDCWQMDKDGCELLLLSKPHLPSLPPLQPVHFASAAAAPLSDAISSPHLQSRPDSSAGSDLGLEEGFPDFAHSGQSWGACAVYEEGNTDLPAPFCAVGVSGSQEYWHEGPQSVACGSDDLMWLSDAPGHKRRKCSLPHSAGILQGSPVAVEPHLSEAHMTSAQSSSQVPVIAQRSAFGSPQEQHLVAPTPGVACPLLSSARFMGAQAAPADVCISSTDLVASETDRQGLKGLLEGPGLQDAPLIDEDPDCRLIYDLFNF